MPSSVNISGETNADQVTTIVDDRIAAAGLVRTDFDQGYDSTQKLQGRENLGLENVDNTSDANKPVSTATQAQLTNLSSLTRAQIATASIPAYILKITTTVGAPMKRGTSGGLYAIQDALGAWWEIDTIGGVGHAEWMDINPDITTNHSVKAQALIDAFDRVFFPPGIYNIYGVKVPNAHMLVGSGKNSCTFRSNAACDYILWSENSTVEGITLNGNLLATEDLLLTGSYNYLSNVHAQFAAYGFYSGGVAFNGDNLSDDSCSVAGFYSYAGFNNAILTKYFSRGGSNYGIYWTYTGDPNLDQPQAVRVMDSLFFGNVNAVWSDKNVFGLLVDATAIDGCTNQAFRVGENSANVFVTHSFVGGNGTVIDIGAGSNQIKLKDIFGFGNGTRGLHIRATAAKVCRDVEISGTDIGLVIGANSPLLFDSPQDDWFLERNNFVAAIPATAMVEVISTYTAVIGSFNEADNILPSGKVLTTSTRIRGQRMKQRVDAQPVLEIQRFTDSSPTGKLLQLLGASGTSFGGIDANGDATLRDINGQVLTGAVNAPTGFYGSIVRNTSSANVTTKFISYEFWGKDTVSTDKQMCETRAQPLDANLSNANLEQYIRVGDAKVRAVVFADKYLILDRLTGYADNAAASAAGVPVGGFYRNTTTNALTQRV